MKRIAAAILAGAVTLCSLSDSMISAESSVPYGIVLPGVSPHNKEVFAGSYKRADQKNLVFLITSSAQTSLLTSTVYNSASEWNSKSSNVHVYIYFNSVPSPMPFNTVPMNVYGKTYTDNVLGETIPYNDKGKVTANSDWLYVEICMNNASNAFSGAINPILAAKKTFTHEVGHTLKLAHPLKDSSIDGHTYSGYPYAIMNQGFPGTSGVSSSPTWHDIECLKFKWGE